MAQHIAARRMHSRDVLTNVECLHVEHAAIYLVNAAPLFLGFSMLFHSGGHNIMML